MQTTTTAKTLTTPANVAVAATSAQTAAVVAKRVRIVSTTNCYIAFGSNPTADSNSVLLPAGVVETFTFTSGNKVAAIRVTADGVLSVMPVG